MKQILIKAEELKCGDVIGGQRVNHEPLIKGRFNKRVHVLLVSQNGYAVKHRKYKTQEQLSVVRPNYNLTPAQKLEKQGIDKSYHCVVSE